jgi:C4-dicarboxylate transporter
MRTRIMRILLSIVLCVAGLDLFVEGYKARTVWEIVGVILFFAGVANYAALLRSLKKSDEQAKKD